MPGGVGSVDGLAIVRMSKDHREYREVQQVVRKICWALFEEGAQNESQVYVCARTSTRVHRGEQNKRDF